MCGCDWTSLYVCLRCKAAIRQAAKANNRDQLDANYGKWKCEAVLPN